MNTFRSRLAAAADGAENHYKAVQDEVAAMHAGIKELDPDEFQVATACHTAGAMLWASASVSAGGAALAHQFADVESARRMRWAQTAILVLILWRVW